MSDAKPRETAGCLTVRLPATADEPSEEIRFILMTPESIQATLKSGNVVRPSPQDLGDSDASPVF